MPFYLFFLFIPLPDFLLELLFFLTLLFEIDFPLERLFVTTRLLDLLLLFEYPATEPFDLFKFLFPLNCLFLLLITFVVLLLFPEL